MSALRRVVVVGGGIAGVTAADTLRQRGFDGELTIVGDEPYAAYSRPALSKTLLRDPDDPTAHELPPASHGGTELRGVAAVGLDVDARTVLLDSGDRLTYDGLVIATGCRARRLGEGEGRAQSDSSDAPVELTLRTIGDALSLRSRVAERPAVVVVGGGPLGMEIASSCLDNGCEVTLVSQGPPLLAQLGRHLSHLFVSAAVARGLRVVESAGARLVRGSHGTRVVLAEGATLEAGLVVTAVGDRPNVEWLDGSGLLDRGALVADAAGRVRPGVVAAGDVASVPTPHGIRRVPLWSSAIDQARTAAAALLGAEPAPGDHRPYFWTEQFGLSLKAVGHLPLDGEPELLDGDLDALGDQRALLRWNAADVDGSAAVAVNYRIPIPRLRRLCEPVAAG
ncbi:NAD(P)/FAD-dependent oxidoreductase [Terrabacter sp. 2RAF25]|uniref:NAD(P)/FAD-dependent oxidoreductase n=1 Tax=Terrabacter sp. 2RAF25 TaxID=3232998 RepID=UPI003F9B8D1F